MDKKGMMESTVGKWIFAIILLLVLFGMLVLALKVWPQLLDKIAELRRIF